MRRSTAPDEGHPIGAEPTPHPWQVTAAHIRVPMTVILGRSQLLQRQIRNGQVWDAAACMETLATIDEAIRQMESGLREVESEQP